MENKVYTRKAFKDPKKNNLLDTTTDNINTPKNGNEGNNKSNSNIDTTKDGNECDNKNSNNIDTTKDGNECNNKNSNDNIINKKGRQQQNNITQRKRNTKVAALDDKNNSNSDDKSNNSTEAPAQPPPLVHRDAVHQQPAPHLDTAVSDDFSSLKKQNVVADNGALKPGSENRVKINLALRSKQEMWELRRKLESELDLARNLVNRIEVKEAQISNSHVPVNDSVDYGFKRLQPEVTSVSIPQEPVKQLRPLNQLNIPVLENSQGVSENIEKEKRTPKANQFYRNSEFLLAKDKFPPAESLGLHDYYSIIKHPMDLGTVKSRLNKNWYKSPREFAEDVRLTFRNAMTYNPKGQDVHIMAEQLSQIFEDKWASIEADYIRDMRLAMEYEASLPMLTPKKAPPILPPPLDMRRIRDRPKSMMGLDDLRPKPIATTPSGRIPTPKKPKAKDPYKRDMTYEEKQKLSINLQSLPSEKLDNIIQIIKKRNSDLFQHDDEIENPTPALVDEVPKEATTNEQNMFASTVEVEKHGDNASRLSSSSSSSSDSGSSSSDSDSESSSTSKSDAGHSPRICFMIFEVALGAHMVGALECLELRSLEAPAI
ncbi:Global transcription factor group E4, putative isoform 2 [Hibiscus syriacus]|uniref:Global transcription factor group E4, putative isoform 2 n=1 Tax=Hibiscus syriacus TaxID=106335 RepID=A0A6A2WPT1_HIBSY|nr:Global transcription factor group E4, putative isoform 2 [Hibiscus syriacus]